MYKWVVQTWDAGAGTGSSEACTSTKVSMAPSSQKKVDPAAPMYNSGTEMATSAMICSDRVSVLPVKGGKKRKKKKEKKAKEKLN